MSRSQRKRQQKREKKKETSNEGKNVPEQIDDDLLHVPEVAETKRRRKEIKSM
jgi:hypothetical protein